MAAPAPEPQEKVSLSWKERLILIDTLNRLPLSQFLVIETALAVPVDVLPGLNAPPGHRSAALMRWLEGSSGPGHLGPLLGVLAEIGLQVFGRSTSQTERNDTAMSTLKVKLEGNFSELDREKLKKLLIIFQRLAQDFNVEINRVGPGSIEIELQGTKSSLRRIKELIDSHAVGSIAGLPGIGTGAITSATTTIGLDLSGANLSGADLSEAYLSGADLSEANLGEAVLSRANLIGADLSEAYLGEADLRRADLSGADLSRADLSKADLREADLRRANLTGAVLSEANLGGAVLSRADLSEANLGGADLSVAYLGRADLSEVSLSGADLSGAYLGRADLRRADLRGANLSGANLSEADLRRADLRGANLRGANLSRADLPEANFSGADLRRADLGNAFLLNAVLNEAKVEKALFIDSSGLTQATKLDLQRRGAIFQDNPDPGSDVPSLVRR